MFLCTCNSVETQEISVGWGNSSGGLVCKTTSQFLLRWYGCLNLHIMCVYCLFIACLLEVTCGEADGNDMEWLDP